MERLRAAGCVFAEEEATLILAAAGGDLAVADELVARRCAGEPLEQVIGWAELDGVRVRVRPGVFIPRRRSVALVRAAVARLGAVPDHETPVVVDLGCGSGALALAVAARVPCTGYAIDVDPVAVACAEENLVGTDIEVRLGDGLDVLPDDVRGRLDVIIANLPYVPSDAIDLLPREARLYEPRATLDGGVDGLAPMAAVLPTVHGWLRPDGRYLAELHPSQVERAEELASRTGMAVDVHVDDDAECAVVVLRPTTGPATGPATAPAASPA